jgi:hypothetical protein
LLPPASALRGQLREDVDAQSLRLPAVGDSTLRILSPSILELTLISAAAKGPPEAPLFGVTVGGIRAEVAAVGAKRRVAYAPLAHSDLRIATEFYIRLARAIDPPGAAQKVEVSSASAGWGSAPAVATAAFDPLRTSPAIHVNQEGYVPSFPKKAMIGYYLGDMGEMDIPPSGFALIDARSGRPVYTGSLTPRPDIGYRTSPAPYQKVLVADFSDFTARRFPS